MIDLARMATDRMSDRSKRKPASAGFFVARKQLARPWAFIRKSCSFPPLQFTALICAGRLLLGDAVAGKCALLCRAPNLLDRRAIVTDQQVSGPPEGRVLATGIKRIRQNIGFCSISAE